LEGFDFERLIVDRSYAAADFVEYLPLEQHEPFD
jgi:hypothetical protein